MQTTDLGWGPKFSHQAMPLRLNRPDGSFAEVVVAAQHRSLPFDWAAYAPDGRVKRGTAGSTLLAQECAEQALGQLRQNAELTS